MNPSGEFIGGLFFLILGVISVVFHKTGARGFAEFQKHFGWTKGSYAFGIAMHLVGGVVFLIMGLIMLFVVRS
jgi:hypothetical protein